MSRTKKRNYRCRPWLALLILVSAASCSSLSKETATEPPAAQANVSSEPDPAPAAPAKDREAVTVSPIATSSLAGKRVFQTGIASWYGKGFHGKATANGEVYDMNQLTAAHPTLPFHTLVEVENMDNQRRVLVRINDRGPFLKNRIIDLSFKAAKTLGMDDIGTARVALAVVKWPEEKKLTPVVMMAGDEPAAREEELEPLAETNAGPAFVVQVGAFSTVENAGKFLATMRRAELGVEFQVIRADGLFRVVTKKLASREQAEEICFQLRSQHQDGFVREWDAGWREN